MSLVGTLAKVAAGVIVAKGVAGMMGGGASGQSLPRSSGQARSGGGLDDILGQVLGGAGGQTGLPRSSGQATSGGGLGDILGQVLGGAGGQAMPTPRGGGLGGMLDQLSQLSRPGGAGGASGSGGAGGFGDLLNQSLDHFGEPEATPTREQEDLAGVLLRAMIQAAKSDGRLDAGEKQRLQEKLQGASREDIEFVNAELQRPIDIDGLARDVPRGAEEQAYTMSALAIDLDQNAEAQYLGRFAQALRLDGKTVNAIHDQLGIPRIFR